MSQEMYREQILELFKHPVNMGELAGHTHSAHKHNPSCGDEFTLQLTVKSGVVSDVKFTGSGCAISTASCCLLTEKVKGMNTADVKKLSEGDLLALLGVPISAGRMKCVLISLEAVKQALS